MDQLQEVSRLIALSMGVAWASGINLYAAILVLGILGSTGNMILPPGLTVLQNPLVLGAAGVMYAIEFVADKVPGIDTGWDALQTFVRIPAGALLAAQAVGPVEPAVALAAGILGGGVAASTHAAKAGSRVLINASPEPFTNSVASVGEDVLVVAGLWTALAYPTVFVVGLLFFMASLVWLLPRLLKGIVTVFKKIRSFFSGSTETAEQPPLDPGAVDD